MKLEVCIDSVESAIAAERGGARRVELCSDLLEGGLTPGAGLIASVRRHVGLDIFVMIRPRGGDFFYSNIEFEVMREEIAQARSLGVNGIVLGLLDEQGCVDMPRTRALVELSAPLPVTFHRAIDMTPDPLAALDAVISTGAHRILTSGGKPNALRGAHEIARMVKRAQGRIAIMPGCGVTALNVAEIAHITGATEFHSSVRTPLDSPVQFRKRGVAMGDVRASEYQRYEVREENVRALVGVLLSLAAEPVTVPTC